MQNFLAFLLLLSSTIAFANAAEDDFCRTLYNANKQKIDSLGIPSDVMGKEIATFQRTSLGTFKHFVACANNLRDMEYVNTRLVKLDGIPIVEVALRVRRNTTQPELAGKFGYLRFVNLESNLSIHSMKLVDGAVKTLEDYPVLITSLIASFMTTKESLASR